MKRVTKINTKQVKTFICANSNCTVKEFESDEYLPLYFKIGLVERFLEETCPICGEEAGDKVSDDIIIYRGTIQRN